MTAASPSNRVAIGQVPARHLTIRELNDRLRNSGLGDQVMMTAGLAALPDQTRLTALEAVRTFDGFDAGNNPHQEHDFGIVEVDGVRCFWKIDAYDRDLQFGSSDPLDPAATIRVLTVMLAEEY